MSNEQLNEELDATHTPEEVAQGVHFFAVEELPLPPRPEWFDRDNDTVTCSQCQRTEKLEYFFRPEAEVPDRKVYPKGWRLIFVHHPAIDENPEIFCPRCSREYPPGWPPPLESAATD